MIEYYESIPFFLTIHLIIFAAGPIIEYKWMSGITLSQYILHFFFKFIFITGYVSSSYCTNCGMVTEL